MKQSVKMSNYPISVNSKEFQEQKTREMSFTTTNGKKGANNTKGSSDHAIKPQQKLFPVEASPKMLTQVLGSIVVCMTHLGIGSIYGFSGITLPQLTQPDSEDVYLSPNNAALFGSVVTIGTAIGSLACGPLVANLGHCKALKLALPLTLALWLMLVYSSNVLLIIMTRAALGVMTGVIATSANTYILEIAHKGQRGMLFSASPILNQCGFFFTFALGSSTLTWRQMAMVCGVTTTIPPFIGLFFFPESPRWLVTRGRLQEAKTSLIYFRGLNYDSQAELSEIIKQVNMDGSKINISNQCRQLFQKPSLYIFLKLSVINFICNFNGSAAINTYMVPIFQAASLPINAYTSAILAGGLTVVGTLCQLVLVDRVGRRPLFLSNYFVMSLAVAIMGVYFYAEELYWDTSNFSWMSVTSLLIYSFFMGLGKSILNIIQGELLPTNVRAIGTSILMFIMYSGTFIVTQVYFLMADTLGVYGTFWTYSVFSMFVAVFSFFVLPETNGFSLEEIADKKCIVEDNHPKKEVRCNNSN